ncbi:hypothetical protein DOY81_009471 [Sarcophaga bullata]|nr:hypothetical protein DOY81_009471 [Sarcophaga bullata]
MLLSYSYRCYIIHKKSWHLAYYAANANSNTDKTPEGIMGILPHSIRGMLSNYENILPATEKFTQCIACSEKVLNTYRSEGNEFLFKVFESAKYLEDLTGISEYRELNNEIIDFNDSDLDLADD